MALPFSSLMPGEQGGVPNSLLFRLRQLLQKGGPVDSGDGESASSLPEIQRNDQQTLSGIDRQATKEAPGQAKELSIAAKEPLQSLKLKNAPSSQDQAGGVPGAEALKQDTKAQLNQSIADQPNQLARTSTIEAPPMPQFRDLVTRGGPVSTAPTPPTPFVGPQPTLPS